MHQIPGGDSDENEKGSLMIHLRSHSRKSTADYHKPHELRCDVYVYGHGYI